MRQINHKELTAAERTEALELKELNRKVDEFTGKFDRLKNKVDNQLIKNDLSIDKSNQDISNVGVNKKTQLILGEKQEEVIKNSLRKM